MRIFLSIILIFATAISAYGAVCEKEDFEGKVSGNSVCLLMRRFGSTSPTTLIVWLHGNISSGGPANYHFPIAQKFATEHAAENVMSVALVRPGYPDGNGEYSTGSDNGRADNWPRETIAEVGTAIERLRLKYRPKTVIIVGHSGGAATAAVLLGMKPKLAEAAVLVSCPCDLVAWRIGRRGSPWSSENPILWARDLPATSRVIALTGSKDSTTSPSLAASYINELKARSINAAFHVIPDVEHKNALGTSAVSDAIAQFMRQ